MEKSIRIVLKRSSFRRQSQYINSTNHYKYITVLDRNQIPQVKNVNLSRFRGFTEDKIEDQIKSKSKFIQYDELLYFQDLGANQDKHYILDFNPRLFKDKRKACREKTEVCKSINTK